MLIQFLNNIKQFLVEMLILFGIFLSPIFPLIFIIGAAIVLDTFYGRWSAKQLGQEITSKKTRVGLLSKMITYQSTLILFYLIDHFMLNEVMLSLQPFQYVITKVVSIFLLWLEYNSIEEKIFKVKGYLITDRIKHFFKGVKNTIKAVIDIKK